MSTALKIYVNNDTQDLPLGTSGVVFTEVSPGNDSLIFSAGSDTVFDGAGIPSSFQLSCAGVFLIGVATFIAHYFLLDITAKKLKEVHLMGQQDKRYVVALDFDGATTSEPVLEVWDNSNMLTVLATPLGAGTPSNSWLHGITTTDAPGPGPDWTGSTLAGSSAGHFLWLNNGHGALDGADTLYCNLYMQVSASQVRGGVESPILVCKYTTV